MEYPKTNKTLRFFSIGGDLKVIEKEVLPLAANEILVKAHAASINPVDIQLWHSGFVGRVAGDKGMGRDYSGKIVAIGGDVKGWSVGDEVFGLLFQPWLPPQSSHQRRVIIRGASGGTGSWLVQLAKKVYNCHVTAICSSKNAEFVKSLDADDVIDYTSEDIISTLLSRRAEAQEYGLLVDCAGGTELLSSYVCPLKSPFWFEAKLIGSQSQLLNTKGAYVTIVGDKTNVKQLGGPITYLSSPAQVVRYIKGWIWGPRYACVSLYTKSTYIEEVALLVERGEVKTEIQEVIQGAFDEREGWRKAIQLMEGGRVRGKVVLSIP
ncbi:hypothetical protein G7Y89_g5443 [Cudoniella acicularis]|uniref:Enoyl reductase (ER) domain-containing protein n=1 Tax=Cudoniella acicularis TaxID=354080 RepID=A0A8H4RMH9_9HELO|nr:hypothetical protein G7Y89_g5443 [Cudoniella acicularis]